MPFHTCILNKNLLTLYCFVKVVYYSIYCFLSDPTSEDKDRDETINNQVVGIPISVSLIISN